MRKFLLLVLITLIGGRLWPAADPVIPAGAPLPAVQAPAGLRFALIKTGEATTLQALVVSGGSLFKTAKINHVAVLVEHPEGRFLFDTGLGSNVDTQFGEEMPAWAKPLFAYEHTNPAVTQLQAAGIAAPGRIFLSHAHWDHASALIDFPQAEIWVPEAERNEAASGQPPAFLPSQLHDRATRWHPYAFTGPPYAGFAASLDVFGDGSVVLIPMPGHTSGSTGLLLSLPNGSRYFFIGDTAWNLEGIRGPSPKFSVSSLIVDDDRAATWRALLKIRSLLDANPQLIVVPAHDGALQDRLGYFPAFVGDR